MIEKTFLDRVPTHPGRVILTPVSGNTYDMVRADSPTVEGTPIDKAAFDSIIQSRLTGRYYQPTVSKQVVSSVTSTVSPVPTSGWVETSTTESTNGSYKLTCSGVWSSTYGPSRAFDGNYTTSGGWRSLSMQENPWIALDIGSPLVVTKIKTYYTAEYTATRCELQGSNNGSSWVRIATNSQIQEVATEWSFTNTAEYRYYRLLFNNVNVKLFEWEFTGYTATSYENNYTVSGWPTVWTTGQIALVQIPTNVVTLGVERNNINGVRVMTVMQPGKRYELRYTGSAFVAKEV